MQLTPLSLCLSLQRINNDNRNSANRSNSSGTRFRSGSLSNFASAFKNGNARSNQNSNDFDMNPTQGNRTMFTDLRARTLSSSAHDLNNNGSNNNPDWHMPPQHFGPPSFDCMPNQPIPYHVINQFKIHHNFNR